MVYSPFIANDEDTIDDDIDTNGKVSGNMSDIEIDAIEPKIKPHLILALDYGVKKWAWHSVIA